MKLSEILNRYFVLPLNQSELVCFSTEDHPEHGEIIVITWNDSDTLNSFRQEFVDQEVDLSDATRFKGQFSITPIGDGGSVAFVALDTVSLSPPKRRPYNASGSLSEYGVFPECDAQQPAEGMKGFDEWFDEYTKNNYTDEMLAEAAWKAALAQQQATGITAAELGYALKRATPAQVIEYLEDDVNMRVALSIHFEEQHDQQLTAVDEMAELVGLLDEVRSHFTRDDDLPDNLLPRIDAALAALTGEQ